MDPQRLVILAFQLSIVTTVFAFGLQATGADLLYLLRRPGLLGRSLLAMAVVVPLVAVGVVLVFELQHTLEVALIALAISPVPPLLPRKEMKAGGNRSYGLALMVSMALLAIVTIPLWVEILQRVFAREMGVSSLSIARLALVSTILPLVAGVAVHTVWPALAVRIAGPVSLIGKVLLPVAILALLAGTWRMLLGTIGDGTFVAVVAFVAIALAVGHLLGGSDPDHSVVLALSSACRHPAIALTIAASAFAGERFVETILLYILVSVAAAAGYLGWRRRWSAAPAAASTSST
jgi:BASS family bile acid:Na+ symporter